MDNINIKEIEDGIKHSAIDFAEKNFSCPMYVSEISEKDNRIGVWLEDDLGKRKEFISGIPDFDATYSGYMYDIKEDVHNGYRTLVQYD